MEDHENEFDGVVWHFGKAALWMGGRRLYLERLDDRCILCQMACDLSSITRDIFSVRLGTDDVGSPLSSPAINFGRVPTGGFCVREAAGISASPPTSAFEFCFHFITSLLLSTSKKAIS